MRANPKRPSLISVMILAILGTALSLWNVFSPESVPCFTDGCQIFKMAAVEGVSLWVFGAAAFIILFIAAFWRLARLAFYLAALFLALDIVLLLIMAAVAPCVECLLIGLLLFFIYLSLLRSCPEKNNIHRKSELGKLAYIWLILFVINIANIAQSQLVKWPLAQNESAYNLAQEGEPVRIFLSPTCAACLRLLDVLEKSNPQNIVIYPVVEDLKEVSIIKEWDSLREFSSNSLKRDLEIAKNEKPFEWYEYFSPSNLLLVLRLWVNQAHVVAQGGLLPLIEIQGVPRGLFMGGGLLGGPQSGRTAEAEATLSEILSLGMDEVGTCGGADQLPCPE